MSAICGQQYGNREKCRITVIEVLKQSLKSSSVIRLTRLSKNDKCSRRDYEVDGGCLDQRGMESVQSIMEQACSAFGVSQILRLVVGDSVVPQADLVM